MRSQAAILGHAPAIPKDTGKGGENSATLRRASPAVGRVTLPGDVAKAGSRNTEDRGLGRYGISGFGEEGIPNPPAGTKQRRAVTTQSGTTFGAAQAMRVAVGLGCD